VILSSGSGGECPITRATIGKGGFLAMIAGPYQCAFTPENIKSSFEKTGTWPIDCSQITTEMTAPSVGISSKSTPIVSLNSPVKHAVKLFNDLKALCSQFHMAEANSHSTEPDSPNSSLPTSPAPAHSPSAIYSLLNGFEGSQASFLCKWITSFLCKWITSFLCKCHTSSQFPPSYPPKTII